MELTCHNRDPSIYNFSYEDVVKGDNVEGPTRNIPGNEPPFPVEHRFSSIESYTLKGYGLESLRTSSSDSANASKRRLPYATIQMTCTNFKHLVLPLTNAMVLKPLKSARLYHTTWTLRKASQTPYHHGSYTASRMGNSSKMFGSVLEGYNTRGRTMKKEKLNRHLKDMAPLHSFVKHATRIHHAEWMRSDYLPMKLTSRDHSPANIYHALAR